MSSQDVIKAVSKKLKYYFEIKRLEDGFDLSGPDCPRLDHPPLRARPTLMYDGLHDRPLKHYFSNSEIRTALTQFKVKGDPGAREAAIKKMVERYLRRYHFVNSSLNAAYYNQNRKGGRKLRREVQGYGIPIRKAPVQHRGGYPVLRSVPSQYASKAEAQRLINIASRLLLATETATSSTDKDDQKDSSRRPKSATASERSSSIDKLPVLTRSHRPQTSKSRRNQASYSRDNEGRKGSSSGNRRQPDQPDSAYSTRPGTGSTSYSSHTAETDGSDHGDDDFKPWLKYKMDNERGCDPDENWVRNVVPPEMVVTSRSQVVVEQYSPRCQSPTGNDGKDDEKNRTKTETEPIHDYNTSDRVLHDGDIIKYRIHVFTGQTIGAGTKADIKIALVGSNGRTEEMILANSRTHKVKFQKGQEDIFDVDCYFIGGLKKIFIGHDQKEMGTDWFLDHVIVKDLEHCQQYYINCDTWLSYRNKDKKTFKDFPVQSSTKFLKEEEEDRSQNYEEQQETHIAIVHTKPKVEEVTSTKELDFTMERKGSQHGTSTQTEYSERSALPILTDSDTTTTYTTSDTTSQEKTTGRLRCADVVSPKHIYKKRSDDFFDQQVTDKDYSSVIESLSVTTEQEKQDHAEFVQQTGSSREPSPKPMTLRPVESTSDAIEQGTENVRGQTDSSDSETEQENRMAVSPTDIKQLLFDAITNGKLNVVKDILAEHPERIKATDEHGWGLLHVAAHAGHADIVQWLTLLISDLETETPTGYTPMHLAAIMGHLPCMKILFAMGASLKSKNNNGETPLYVAAKHGMLDIVTYLVQNNVDVEVRDVLGNTAMDVAKSSGIRGAKQCYEYLRRITDDKKTSEISSELAGSTSARSTSSVDSSSSSSTTSSSSSSSTIRSNHQTRELEKQKHEEEMSEKKRLYEEQHSQMAETNMTFMDSIRAETEQS